MMVETLPINRLQHHNKHSNDNVTLLLLGMTRTDRRDELRGSVADHGLAAVRGVGLTFRRREAQLGDGATETHLFV